MTLRVRARVEVRVRVRARVMGQSVPWSDSHPGQKRSLCNACRGVVRVRVRICCERLWFRDFNLVRC